MKKLSILTVSLALFGCGDDYNASQNNDSSTQTVETNVRTLNLKTFSQSEVCQYNFDATQEDYDVWNAENPEYFPIKVFPEINSQKFGLTIPSVTENEYNFIDYLASSKAQLSASDNEGDFSLPTTGIIAFEMQLKIPIYSLGNSSYTSRISLVGITNNGYSINSNFGFQSGTYDPEFGENPANVNYYMAYRLTDESGPTTSYYQNASTTNNSNNYQRLGIYINQATKQVGYIFNGVDQGYQSSLPAALQKLSFTISSGVAIYSNHLSGQELSSELITDRGSLQFNYPQGTTDICGNTI